MFTLLSNKKLSICFASLDEERIHFQVLFRALQKTNLTKLCLNLWHYQIDLQPVFALNQSSTKIAPSSLIITALNLWTQRAVKIWAVLIRSCCNPNQNIRVPFRIQNLQYQPSTVLNQDSRTNWFVSSRNLCFLFELRIHESALTPFEVSNLYFPSTPKTSSTGNITSGASYYLTQKFFFQQKFKPLNLISKMQELVTRIGSFKLKMKFERGDLSRLREWWRE